MSTWLLAAALSLAGAPAVAPPVRAQIMEVPTELQADLRARVLEAGRSDRERLERLLDFLADTEHGLAMKYRDDATLTVAEAYRTRQANCLTYTLLFIALAQLAGLDAYPQEIDETLAWQQRDGVVYRTNHVNAGIRVGTRRFTVDVGSSFVMARHPAHRITIERLLAQYYNNLAAGLMAEKRLPEALAHAQAALELDPSYPVTWSNTGVLRLHDGDLDGARRAYDAALRLDPGNSAALFNLIGLYQRTGQRSLELSYRKRLDRIQQADPFHQFLMAAEYERNGDAVRAIRHYQRAIRLYGTEHRFHYGLARAYLLQGDRRRAMRALQDAMALAGEDTARASYQQQWNALAGLPGR